MEDEYKRLIEEIRDVYFIIQQERLVLVSNYTAELYGYSRDELIGKHFHSGGCLPGTCIPASGYHQFAVELQKHHCGADGYFVAG